MMRAVRFGAKTMPQPKRQSFETVAAAEFVRANLSQGDMPEITASAAEGVFATFGFRSYALRRYWPVSTSSGLI